MSNLNMSRTSLETARHRTSYLDIGAADAPVMIFVHGWPELGVLWRAQLDHFAAAGWRCIAPDMRGYGGSSVPVSPEAYAMREIVADMVELHDALGGQPAIWVGHDWGSGVVWQIAVSEPSRCRGVVSLNVPYLPDGIGLESLIPLVDREVYPVDRYPLGQWDYMQFQVDDPVKSAEQLNANVAAFTALGFRHASADVLGKPNAFANIRAQGGWFGPAGPPPAMPPDPAILSVEDYETMVQSFAATGFEGPNSWYRNEQANREFAAQFPDRTRLTMPVLFLGAEWDTLLDTARTPLAEQMRAACTNLTEVNFEAGHWLAQEKSHEVSAAIDQWLVSKDIIAIPKSALP